MTTGSRRDSQDEMYGRDTLTFTFPTGGQLETTEQIRRFELLRLAFFALKLRKLEQRQDEVNTEKGSELEFHRNLLRHAIFQQVLTLIQMDSRDQALQIIQACQK